MREEEFRERLRGALGEPPASLGAPMLGRPASSGAARTYPRLMGLLAIGVAVLLILVLVGSRVTLRPRGNVLPAATPTGVAQLALDSMPCHLAVYMVQEADNPGQPSAPATSLGFVNIPSGTFFADPGATVQDLPAGSTPSAALYSAELHRWLPATNRSISPNHRSYAYVKLTPPGATFNKATGSELHVVDGATGFDRKLWASGADIEVIEWTSSGILASTVPWQGGIKLLWRVDPVTGTATQVPQSADPTFFNGTPIAGIHNYSYLGPVSEGNGVYRLGGRDAGTAYYVVTVDPGGRVTTIYGGKAGDATDFDPEGTYSDAHGLWFGNFDGTRMWLWVGSKGLQSFKVSGGPPAPAGYQYSSITFLPAGPCVPGEFRGVAATPLPKAPTPSPSPTPPYVDWSVLMAKPLILPDVAGGAPCNTSSQVSLQVNARPGSGKWPNYGFGRGPAYLSGQIYWYSAGSQAMLVLVDPKYTGPVLVRVKRLDGAGSITLTGDGADLGGGAFGIPQTSTPPYWGTWIGSFTPSAPGCYGIQFDGTSFTDEAVFEVKQGPPPPG